MREKFGLKVSHTTVQKWLDEADEAQRNYEQQKHAAENPGIAF
jgi:transposase-like protein